MNSRNHNPDAILMVHNTMTINSKDFLGGLVHIPVERDGVVP